MIIDISKVISTKDKSIKSNCTVDMDIFDSQLGSFPIINKKPFELSVVNDNSKHINISCDTKIRFCIPCDRCLEDVDVNIDISINKTFSIQDGMIQIDEDEELTFVNEEKELDVDRLLFDEILVNWPSKVLCKEDCKGICFKCGANLNVNPCECDRKVLDPRMAKFQDVFREFKEV